LTPKVGVNVDYYRCPACALLFSPSFDKFSQDEWKTYVYNPEYASIDPEYTGERGRNLATTFAATFPHATSLHLIDYGCGLGTMGERLRELQWQNVTNYDPFVPRFSERPTSRADLVAAVEVLEHSHNPVLTFDEIASLRADSGIIIATTLLAPLEADASILDWWYVAPRNGHVTIHSPKSLAILAARARLNTASVTAGNVHYFWQQRPDWASSILPA